MMNERIFALAAISLGVGVLLIGASLIVAAVNLQTGISPDWLVTAFQWIFLVSGGFLTLSIGGWTFVTIVKEVKTVSQHYHQEIIKVKERTPTIAAAMSLFSLGWVTLADHAFGKDDAAAIAVSMLLLGIFWLSNELCIRDAKGIRVVGYSLWVLGVVCLPLAVMMHKSFTFTTFLDELINLDLRIQISCGLGAIVLLLLPLILIEKEPK